MHKNNVRMHMPALLSRADCNDNNIDTILQTAHRTTAYTKHGNCRSRVEALSLGPSATQQGGVGNVSVRGAR